MFKRLFIYFIKIIGILMKKRVWFARYLGVKIGKDCRIYITEWPTEPFLISIGDRVTVTAGCKFITHDGAGSIVKDSNGNRCNYFAPIKIGNDVFIGINSIILPGVEVCPNTVIAAGSVVSRSITVPGVYAGVPARFVKGYDQLVKHFSDKGSFTQYSSKCSSYKQYVEETVKEIYQVE
jgi:acetyltransferase-like isoleucine patch superfamily enzyme